MRKCIDVLKQSPIITGVIGVVVAVGGTKILGPATSDLITKIDHRVLLFLSMCVFIYLISREKAFEKCHTTTGYAVRWGLLILIPQTPNLLLRIFSGQSIASDWPIKFVLGLILCLFVGLFEESAFRVIINDAILYKFRNSRHVFVWIAIISSLVFGAVHVFPANISTASAVMNVSLKTIQTGLTGFCFLILYWKTRNLWGIALAHALYDAVSIVPAAIYDDTSGIGSADSYVNAGGEAVFVYLVYICILAIVAIILWTKIGRKIDFEEIRKTW